MLRRLALRLRLFFGYIPNVEWFRAGLSRAIALDRAHLSRNHPASYLTSCATRTVPDLPLAATATSNVHFVA
jgi:hypothetical protein